MHIQAQLTQEVKRADTLSAELTRQQDESARGHRSTKSRATGDLLMSRTQGGAGGGPPSDPLIPAGRPAGGASNAGSELELLRRKLKVTLPHPSPCYRFVNPCLHPHIAGMGPRSAVSPGCLFNFMAHMWLLCKQPNMAYAQRQGCDRLTLTVNPTNVCLQTCIRPVSTSVA